MKIPATLTAALTLLLASLPFLAPAQTSSSQPTTRPADAVLTEGFIFYGGNYVAAPYRLTIRGDELLLNNTHSIAITRTSLNTLNLDPRDPGPPPNLTPTSTYFDLHQKTGNPPTSHIIRKWEHVVATQPEEKAIPEMITYLKSLPPVADVAIHDQPLGPIHATLKINMKDGKENFIILAPPMGRKPPVKNPDKISATQPADDPNLSPAEKQSAWIQGLLSNGGCLFLDNSGNPKTFLGPTKAASCLGAMVEILQSKHSEDVKTELLQRAGILPPVKSSKPVDLIENFQPSADLDKRIAEAVTKHAVTPLQLKDLETPTKSPP